MLEAYLKGFFSGGSLIVAIGAQNAFVLSRGIRGEHTLVVPLICSLCDAVFISLGIILAGTIGNSFPLAEKILIFMGASFLFFYGGKSFYSAFGSNSLGSGDAGRMGLIEAVFGTFAVTLLNPHFYMDTVFLMGGISLETASPLKPFFFSGAISASVLWFFSLSIGASFLRGFFEKPGAWKALDICVGVTMWVICFSLVKDVV